MNPTEISFDKKCTHAAKGIAFFLMVLHHVLTDNGNYIPSLSLDILGEFVTVEVLIGRFGKLCVAIFSFLGGYGLFLNTKNLDRASLSFYLLGRIRTIYFSFWKAFIAFISLCFLLTGHALTNIGWKDLLLNLLALRNDICGAWWFLGPYAFLIILFPFVKRFVNRSHASLTIDVFFVFLLWTFCTWVYPQLMNHPYMNPYSANDPLWWQFYLALQLSPAFLSGAIAAKYNLFSLSWQHLSNKPRRITVALLACIVSFLLRTSHGNIPENQMPDFLYAFMFIFGTVTILKEISFLNHAFCYLGKHSLYLWLMHGGIIYYVIPYLPKLPFGAPLMVAVVIVGSLILSFLIHLAERFFYSFCTHFPTVK